MLPTGSLETVLSAMARTLTHGPRSVKATRPCLFRPDQYIYAGKRGGKFLTRSAPASVQEPVRAPGSTGRPGRAIRAGGAPSRWLAARLLMALAGAIGAAVATPVVPAAPPPAHDAVDPLVSYLAEEDYEQARPRILEALRLGGGSSCTALAAYPGNRSGRVREHAVRALSDAGCAAFESYRVYMNDADAWVTEAVIEAARRHLMPDAVPFLLARLSDARRIVAQEGTRRIGDDAHRVLQMITCQSFHYDPEGTEDDRRNALTRWRQWYIERHAEPRDAWVKEGIARARDYAGRDYLPHRLEGLRLLALIGEPALPDLRALIRREPGDVQADLSCQPEEPPRPTDRVPCRLLVRDASASRVVLAPPAGGPVIRLGRADAPAELSPPDQDARAPGGVSGVHAGAPVPGALAERMVVLLPGEVRRYEFTVGPVPTAGRYRVRATLADLAAEIVAGAAAPSASPPPAPPSPRAQDKRGSSKSQRTGAAPKPGAAPPPALSVGPFSLEQG